MATHFADRHTVDSDASECLLHLIDLEGLNDRFEFFHRESLMLRLQDFELFQTRSPALLEIIRIGDAYTLAYGDNSAVDSVQGRELIKFLKRAANLAQHGE
jgi:hypothetical protein